MLEEKEIKISVAEARSQQDVGRNVARLSKKNMNELELRQGYIIEIESSKKSEAIVRSGYAEDEGLDIVRIDGLIRRNTGASIGEKVTIRRTEVKEAKRIVIAPTEKYDFYIYFPLNAFAMAP